MAELNKELLGSLYVQEQYEVKGAEPESVGT